MSILVVIAIFLMWFILDIVIGRKWSLKRTQALPKKDHLGSLELLTSGTELMSSLFRDLKQANDHIHIMFYILRNDEISQELCQLLIQKAKEGVAIKVLVDYIGSFQLKRSMIKQLKANGIQFAFSNRPKLPFFFYSLNNRNHRKITVIDGAIGYLGGFNIGREYVGRDPKFGFWRDFHLRFIGDGVQSLQRQFILDWEASTRTTISHQSYYPFLQKGNIRFSFFSFKGDKLKPFFHSLIEEARHSIVIGTPYFIPGKELLEACIRALERGVKVTILVPLKADHPFVQEASYPYFRLLLLAGADVYTYFHGFYHAKIYIIDDVLCDIGTANFDKRSFFLNEEMNCLLEDETFIQQVVVKAMKHDLVNAKKLTFEDLDRLPLWTKIKSGIATLISPLL